MRRLLMMGAPKGLGGGKQPRQSRIALSCHMPGKDVTIKLNRMDAVPFSHIRHLGVETQNSTQGLQDYHASIATRFPLNSV